METQAVMQMLREVADEVVMPRFRQLEQGQVFEKSPGDLVTIADQEAEVLITRRLLSAYPDAVVLGEEAYATDPRLMDRYVNAGHAFTVDPVDGTKNFVRGSHSFAVMLSEVRDRQVVRAWIWQPATRVGYIAERGAGAFRDGRRLSVTAPADLERSQGATSRRRWRHQSIGGLPPTVMSWTCCGVDFPKVIEGAVDYLVWGTSTPWDHAPGSLLLQESGGVLGWPEQARYDPQDPRRIAIVAAVSQQVWDRVATNL